MLKQFAYISVLTALCALCIPLRAEVDSADCLKQMKDLPKTSIDCAIAITASKPEQETLGRQTSGAINYFNCILPLKFDKKEIYGEWIKPGLIALPKITLRCDLTGGAASEAGGVLPISTAFSPHCTQNGSNWLCNPQMTETTGIGFLGRVIEHHINNSEEIKKGMGEALSNMTAK